MVFDKCEESFRQLKEALTTPQYSHNQELINTLF